MRILLYCLPRTRSSYFQSVLCKFYNLDNFFEPYTPLESKVVRSTLFRSPENIWEKYKVHLVDTTKHLCIKNNFVTKLFMGNTYNTFKNLYNKSYKDISFYTTDLLDLEEYFSISKYDKIFILRRKNLTDALCSYFFARQNKIFLYDQSNANLINFYKRKPVDVKLESKLVESAVFDNMLMDLRIDELTNKNISHEVLFYEDIPNYVCNNFGKIESPLTDTNFDYQSLIKNYNQIAEDLKKIKINLGNKITRNNI